MDLRDVVNEMPLIDNHAHAVEPLSGPAITEHFQQYFTEGALSNEHARHTLNYRSALSLLAEQFGAEDESILLKRRANVDTPSYSRELLETTNTETILVDDGFPDVTPDEFRSYTHAEIRPIRRIEPVVEDLVEHHDSFSTFEEAFVEQLRDALDGDCVALKSVVAYRTGLDVDDPLQASAREAFADMRDNWDGRIEHPILLDYLVHQAAEVAAEFNIPLQFHTGFGDSDAHPRYVDPTHLYDFLRAHPNTHVVLLHAGYPYVRNAGYVTATLDNVYLDLSLATPFVQHGVKPLISQTLELAPTSKLLYASDAFSVPELYVLAARRFRTDLASVLERLVDEGFLTESYATSVAENVLRENAVRLYDL